PTKTCTDSIVRSERMVAPSSASRTSRTTPVVAVSRSLPSVPPTKRRAARLLPGDVTPEEHEVRGTERQADVERADPERADDRRPVGGRPQEAVPGLELRPEQVRAKALGAGQDADE